MEIKLISKIDSYYSQEQGIFINDKSSWYSRDLASDCPEDATLDRDMTSGHEIIKLMEIAFEAGKNGETLTVSKETLND